MVLFTLIFGFTIASAAEPTPCLSLLHRMKSGPITPKEVSTDTPERRVMEKQARTPLGGLPQSKRTENFFIQWGTFDGFSDEDIVHLATALETSWDVQVNAHQYPLPRGAETYLVNVYIGNTHERAPQIFSNARAYVDTDDDGYTRIVVAPSLLAKPEALKTTAAHELFHTIQWHANADYQYAPNSPANWYWEATAVWMEQEVFPTATSLLRHLPSFLFYPELPLNTFTLESTGALSDTHAYGAFLFPLYLDLQFPDSDMLRTSFTDTQGTSDPLQVLERLLIEQNTTLQNTFFKFSEANGTLNYPEREAYLNALEPFGGFNTTTSNRPSGTLSYHNAEWKSDEDHFPPSLGANYWRVVPGNRPYALHVESFEEGEWYAAVVSFDGVRHTTTSSLQWSGKDTVTLVTEVPISDAWLVIATYNPTSDTLVHPYRVSFETIDKKEDTGDSEGEEPPTGQCSGVVNTPFSLLGCSLVVSGLRRRRKNSLNLAHQSR